MRNERSEAVRGCPLTNPAAAGTVWTGLWKNLRCGLPRQHRPAAIREGARIAVSAYDSGVFGCFDALAAAFGPLLKSCVKTALRRGRRSLRKQLSETLSNLDKYLITFLFSTP